MNNQNNFTWNNELSFQLIELYEERRELWDSTIEDFKDRDKKQNAWVEIGTLMNTNTDVVQKKMKSLIGQFRREMMKSKQNSKWYAFNKFSFLKPRVIREMAAGIKNSTHYITTIPTQAEDQHTHLLIESVQEIKENSDSELSLPTRKRHRDDPLLVAQEPLTRKELDTESQRDEYTTYGELVAMKLRKIGNHYARSTAQYHINNILYKAEIGAYDRQEAVSQSRESNYKASSSTSRHDFNDDSSRLHDMVLKLEDSDG